MKAAIITTADELTRLCDEVREAGSFAFDTEFEMESTYQALVCLAQVATASRTALIDPLGGLDLAPMWSLVADPAVECIVHAGAEDLALSFRATGQAPANVFDVQIAAGFVGYGYPMSLARLVREIAGKKLHKSQTLTNWQTRPLSAAQIEYARDDVSYLPALRDHIGRKLEKLGRMKWVGEEFARLENVDTYTREETKDLRRLKGCGGLDGQELAIARELLATRERLALELNRPARVVLRDHLLVEIARHRWTSTHEMRALRGFHVPRKGAEELAAAVERALKLPSDQWPQRAPVREETDETAVLTALLTAVVRDHCQKIGLAYELVATRSQLERVVGDFLQRGRIGGGNGILGGWRDEAVGELLEGVLSGRRGVRVANSPNGRLVVE